MFLLSTMSVLSDLYGGFDDNTDYANELGLGQSQAVQQAIARSSHGRRTATGARLQTSSGLGFGAPQTASMSRSGRVGTAYNNMQGPARPMTAVRAAGYTSFLNKEQAVDQDALNEKEVDSEEQVKEMEKKVHDAIQESITAMEKKDFKEAMEKAKDAGRRERLVIKFREQHKIMEKTNLDLTYIVLFNLAQQYINNDMGNEAVNTYEILVKNKMFPNAGKLKVNIGNIYFKKKDYNKAIKYYRMAMDQVPPVQKATRLKILNNIGVAFIKTGKYDEALSAFQHCIEEKAEFNSAMNLVLTSYCLNDDSKMRDAFNHLLDVSLPDEDDSRPQDREDRQLLTNDVLRQFERTRRRTAERTILAAAKIIAPVVASDYASGYEWCVECIKRSTHASLATELEMTKAGELLRKGDLQGAMDVLKVFHAQDSKTASAASNNLAMMYLLQGGESLMVAENYAETALKQDHYNANALVNTGNIAYQQEQYDKAYNYYKEALSNEAGCVQAIYNMGLVCKKQGNMEQALDCFYKLHNILLNNVQVLCQLATIYHSLEDSAQAIELYSQANSLAPTDPAILSRLAKIYDAEGDKSQAFQCHYDSYRYYPSNMAIIEWLGAYYIETQFSEKALQYFEKAAIMQPMEIKWQLMMASSQRRAGNYQKALDLYKIIHKRFPNNVECLKFLVRLCTDLGLAEAREYSEKLQKLEKVRSLRVQRETDSSQGKRHSANSAQSLPTNLSANDNSTSRGRTGVHSAQIPSDEKPFEMRQRELTSTDLSYRDPTGGLNARPKTSSRRLRNDDSFEDLDFTLLPE